jgi:hypothetical protein
VSKLDKEKRTRVDCRILLLAYLFKEYLGRDLPNHVAANYETTPDYKTYEDERDQLIWMQLIKPGGEKRKDTRVVTLGLTDKGLKHVKNMLAGGLNENYVREQGMEDRPELTVVRKLRPFSLLSVVNRPCEVESFFKMLVTLYPDWFFKRGAVPAFIEEMANDVSKGFVEIDRRMARRLGMLYYDVVTKDEWWKKGDERLEKLVTELIGAFSLLKRVAYLSYIWWLYGFNRLAYHTVVRHAAFRESGWLYRIYTHVMAAMVGHAFFTIAQAFNLIPFETLATITLSWVAVFIALTAAEDLPKYPRIRKALARKLKRTSR